METPLLSMPPRAIPVPILRTPGPVPPRQRQLTNLQLCLVFTLLGGDCVHQWRQGRDFDCLGDAAKLETVTDPDALAGTDFQPSLALRPETFRFNHRGIHSGGQKGEGKLAAGVRVRGGRASRLLARDGHLGVGDGRSRGIENVAVDGG